MGSQSGGWTTAGLMVKCCGESAAADQSGCFQGNQPEACRGGRVDDAAAWVRAGQDRHACGADGSRTLACG